MFAGKALISFVMLRVFYRKKEKKIPIYRNMQWKKYFLAAKGIIISNRNTKFINRDLVLIWWSMDIEANSSSSSHNFKQISLEIYMKEFLVQLNYSVFNDEK